MDNRSGVDADTTDLPSAADLFAPCLTWENTGERQGAHLFPHSVHKIGHRLWTTRAGRPVVR
ncbi:hypothetical protein GCM10010365_34830 [Streptomyces poonensis]|uniref:Uncharacterized protein n=1 Tax=Streptomyces poonensis TaxID=68255 RepID=A0A918PKS6_9ACTN|nr:hypothetical protein GCM10010365_34830 [Streptomyces poonensis]GLJ93760.1 hypothetical protein GCM10017589_63760 [Streptomyces poonensis]